MLSIRFNFIMILKYSFAIYQKNHIINRILIYLFLRKLAKILFKSINIIKHTIRFINSNQIYMGQSIVHTDNI